MTGNGINTAVLYHMKYGVEGAGIFSFWKIMVWFVLLISICVFFIFKIYHRTQKREFQKKFLLLAYPSVFASFIFSPMSLNLYDILITPDNKNFKYEFDDYYSEVNLEKIGKTKNLIFIYGESLEQTYFDENIFPDLMSELKKWRNQSTYFSSVETLEGNGWTIGGIVGSQCGIPLITPSGNQNFVDTPKFLPNAICLSDLLKNENYYLTYFGGAELKFGRKDLFFENHNFDEVYGRIKLEDMVDQSIPRHSWGIHDDSLFELAYQHFSELSAKKEKQAMFVLTLDTHHPYGESSPECNNIKYKNGKNSMLNAVACSDKLISDFIKKISESSFAKDTVVVVTSDHIALPNVAEKMLKKGDRKNLFMVIDFENLEKREVNQKGSTMDIGATILPFIGYRTKLGFGRDLMSDIAEPNRVEVLAGAYKYWRNDMNFLWGLETKNEKIFVIKRIAHAGGGLGENVYTNSFEAMQNSVENGMEYLEIDLSFTSDGELVCIHDWGKTFEQLFGQKSERVSLVEFEKLVQNKKEFTICTLDTLVDWLENNKKIKIVTDIKDTNFNLNGLKLIKESFDEYADRIIPQIYNPEDYNAVKELGYKNIIWTLYAYSGSKDDVYSWVEKMEGLSAVAMFQDVAENGVSTKIKEKGIPVYVHTINDKNIFDYLVKNFGVTEIYTDYLYTNN